MFNGPSSHNYSKASLSEASFLFSEAF